MSNSIPDQAAPLYAPFFGEMGATAAMAFSGESAHFDLLNILFCCVW